MMVLIYNVTCVGGAVLPHRAISWQTKVSIRLLGTAEFKPRASLCAAVLRSVDQQKLPEALVVLVKPASEGLPNVHK